jgi:hypothetical protein
MWQRHRCDLGFDENRRFIYRTLALCGDCGHDRGYRSATGIAIVGAVTHHCG